MFLVIQHFLDAGLVLIIIFFTFSNPGVFFFRLLIQGKTRFFKLPIFTVPTRPSTLPATLC